MPANGRLTDTELSPIAQGRLARANYCAASWNAMNVEARSLGLELTPTGSKSSYRTYEQQVELYNLYLSGRGALAARPGTSNHGMGLAVDVATRPMRAMIDRIGRRYGWAKEWSNAAGEWWHLAYRAGVWSGSDPGPYGSGLVETDIGAITTVVAANGSLHVFAERVSGAGAWGAGSLWYCWQATGSTAWSGGRPGVSAAGLSAFAPAPS